MYVKKSKNHGLSLAFKTFQTIASHFNYYSSFNMAHVRVSLDQSVLPKHSMVELDCSMPIFSFSGYST